MQPYFEHVSSHGVYNYLIYNTNVFHFISWNLYWFVRKGK